MRALAVLPRLTLWLTVRSLGDVRRDPFQEEFADQIRRSICARVGQSIKQNQRGPAIGLRIVKIRNGSGGEVAEHVRVIGPPPSVVVSRHDGSGHRIQRARTEGSLALIEVARVLMEN